MDAKAYVYLAKNGPKREKEIAVAMKLGKDHVCASLKILQKKGFISQNAEFPELFSALNFEKVLDLMITLKDEEAYALEETRKELLSSWRTLTQNKKQHNT
jgi:sugar-specific transcriptional regulator TrmB